MGESAIVLMTQEVNSLVENIKSIVSVNPFTKKFKQAIADALEGVFYILTQAVLKGSVDELTRILEYTKKIFASVEKAVQSAKGV
jgi:hypothetical protein